MIVQEAPTGRLSEIAENPVVKVLPLLQTTFVIENDVPCCKETPVKLNVELPGGLVRVTVWVPVVFTSTAPKSSGPPLLHCEQEFVYCAYGSLACVPKTNTAPAPELFPGTETRSVPGVPLATVFPLTFPWSAVSDPLTLVAAGINLTGLPGVNVEPTVPDGQALDGVPDVVLDGSVKRYTPS